MPRSLNIENLRRALNHSYSADTCFMCAEALTPQNYSGEHVIPKWAQERFNLWNNTIRLLNGTFIKYRQLIIPCCKECNGIDLSQIENKVKDAFEQGIDSVKALPKLILLKWLAKIFLGIVYKEKFLPVERRDPSAGNIVEPDFLRQYSILHFWLQISELEESAPFQPGSIFIFSTEDYPEIENNFDILDNPIFRTIAIRMGKVGVIADFLENGMHERSVGDFFERYAGRVFNPIQFRELAASIFYKASLLNMETEVNWIGAGDQLGFIFKTKPISQDGEWFGEWDQERYAQILSFYTQLPLSEIFSPPDKVMTWINVPNPQSGS